MVRFSLRVSKSSHLKILKLEPNPIFGVFYTKIYCRNLGNKVKLKQSWYIRYAECPVKKNGCFLYELNAVENKDSGYKLTN